ncbi:ShlB/FhaC/HecB family hemolysin secretion/activation protein [Castellaniella sp.]|uniref:ShlB/FhaC/HecB family hemolysin secretion/activation protein n=1 Tax=Castellaniella sp. TaxID=1955812 RepID=UPI003C750654
MTLIGLALGACLSPAWADGPVRGNPLDSIPSLPTPGHTGQQPTPTLQPGGDAAAQRQQALQARLGQTVVPRHFNVAGNTVVPLSQIIPILEPLIGKSLSVSQLIAEVGKITKIYQDRGYLLSFALLQNQDFRDGLVRVTIVEGYVDRVDFQGDAGPAEDRLKSLSKPLLDAKPLTRATLERALNLMRKVPGVKVQPQMDLPKFAGGATPLILHVQRHAFRAEGGLADMGSGLQPMVGIVTGSLTPLGEQIRLTGAVPIGSHDVKYISGQISIPIGHDGLEMIVDGYHYESHPEDGELQDAGLKRRVVNEQLGVGLRYPLLLDNKRSLTIEGGVYASRSLDEYRRNSDNLWLNQRTDLRVLRAGLRYRDADEKQSRNIGLNIYHGLSGAGAGKRYATNATPSGQPVDLAFPEKLDFTRYALDLEQTVKLPAGFGITFSGFGQYSTDPLPTTEQTSFGAWRYGLGYPQGELAGDKGYGVALELNRQFKTGWSRVSDIQPYVKIDRARAWYNQANTRLVSSSTPTLSSIALGARITDNRHYIFDVNVAKPIGDPATHDDRRGVRVNANYSLLYGG